MRFTHLASLALRLSDQQPFPTALIEKIVEMHGTHLRCARFMGFTLSSQGLKTLMGSEGLEKLAVSVPIEDIVSFYLFFCQRGFRLDARIIQYTFASALADTATLHTLVHVVEHRTHGKQTSLTTDRVRVLLEDVPSLARDLTAFLGQGPQELSDYTQSEKLSKSSILREDWAVRSVVWPERPFERRFWDGSEGQLMEMEMLDVRDPLPETLDEVGISEIDLDENGKPSRKKPSQVMVAWWHTMWVRRKIAKVFTEYVVD